MATTGEIAELRLLIAEPNNVAPYTDDILAGIIDSKESINAAANIIWTSKAAQAAHLVNISEGGSSRSMSDVHKNALAMAAKFVSDDAAAVVQTSGRARTRPIERA